MNDINYFINPVVLNISRNQMFIGLSVLGLGVFTYLSNKYLHNISQTSNQYYIKTNTNSSNNLHNNTKIGISQINTNNIINNDTNYTDTNDTDIHDTDTYDTNIVKNNDVINTFNTNITPNLTLTKLTTLQSIIYIYWNGDLNSTYLLIDLLLQDKIIQPLYIEKYTILKNLEYKKLEQMVKQYNDINLNINSDPINIYQKKVMYKIKLYLEGISLIKHKQHKEMDNIELLRKLILQKYPEFKHNLLYTLYITTIAKDLEHTSQFFNTLTTLSPIHYNGIEFIEQVTRFIKNYTPLNFKHNINNTKYRILLGYSKQHRHINLITQLLSTYNLNTGIHTSIIEIPLSTNTINDIKYLAHNCANDILIHCKK